jgi:hypothetical protein
MMISWLYASGWLAFAAAEPLRRCHHCRGWQSAAASFRQITPPLASIRRHYAAAFRIFSAFDDAD